MKRSWKRALSTLLAIAMIAGLLTIPAGAAGSPRWDFENKGAADGFTDASFSDITIKIAGATKWQSKYGAVLAAGDSISFTVTESCNVDVRLKHSWNVYFNEDSTHPVIFTKGGGDEVVTFHCKYTGSEEPQTVTLNAAGSAWVSSIDVSAYSEAVPTLEVAGGVHLKANDKAVTVEARVKDSVGMDITDWTASSNDSAVAEASINNGVVTITPRGEGETTVAVSANVNGAVQTKNVAVVVDKAGDYTEWDFTAQNYWADSEKVTIQGKSGTLRGLGINASSGKFDGTQLGTSRVQFNQNTIIEVPVKALGDGKVKVTVKAYAANTISVDDQPNTSAEQTFECDGTDNKVTVKATAAAYLIFIKVEYDEDVTGTDPCACGGVAENCQCDPCACEGCDKNTQGGGNEGGDTPVTPTTRKIDVWDFAGKEDSRDGYINNITPAVWEKTNKIDTSSGNKGKLLDGGEITFGDLVMHFTANDRIYSSVAAMSSMSYGSGFDKDYGDDYTSAGGWYINGPGNNTNRYPEVKNVKAGDKIVAYVTPHQDNADDGVINGIIFTFEGQGQKDDADKISGAKNYTKLSFVAEKDGTYKLYQSNGVKSNKPMYQRIVRYPGVAVSGQIDTSAASSFPASGYELIFTNQANKKETKAAFGDDGKSFTVTLAPGFTYSATLSGAPGWGLVGNKEVTTTDAESLTGKTGVTLQVGAKTQYTYSGEIKGFAEDYSTDALAITMIPSERDRDDGADEVPLKITGKTFTAQLDSDVEYTLKMEEANDYRIVSPDKVKSAAALQQDITVTLKDKFGASGKFVILDADDQYAPLSANNANSGFDPLTATVTKLQFKILNDEGKREYVYDAQVANGGYEVQLRPGDYEAVATVDGYTTHGHVVVTDKAVAKDLLFVPTTTPAAVDYAKDIYVDGKGGTDLHFKTVTGAMAYIKRMGARTEEQRVTVHITPGTYREQIDISSPYVTFVNTDPSKEVKLTWYYGIGYKYYSSTGTLTKGGGGYYDAEKAFDRYAMGIAARWGCTVRVQAPGFQAQDVIFENSFNYYVTNEEQADGAEPVKDYAITESNITTPRNYSIDPTSKGATERAAVLWVNTNNGYGDMTEFKNCKFLSSQDTIVTGKRMYFKDCYIEGMTDYICGPGDVVFDTCTLNWKGYSDDDKNGGYITAPQTQEAKNGSPEETGYLFRNCYITGDTKLKLAPGGMGRTWGTQYTGCIFYNTTLQSEDLLKEPTWADMNGFQAKNATRIHEWGTMLPDGTKVDLSKRTLQNTVAETAPQFDVESDYFNQWKPVYYTAEAATVALKEAPTVTDNGDINKLKPGHTLTVSYTLTPEANNANDASTIQWYRVKDGAETLVKTANATTDKTYQVQAADIGYQIKVTVTPKTIGGLTGEAMSHTIEYIVDEGFEDPSGATDPELGSGVNIFLAGDSTVRDYSAKGMYNTNAPQNAGSWGEFLQSYMNSDLVTIVNYANGGRSSRDLIEDGKLDAIAGDIKEGDYLFIQFGHNDAYDADSRFVPLGEPVDGVYPTTPGVKGSDGKYTGGTYKGYLQMWVDMALDAGATPVLMTPVSRMYYTADGTIRPHHDSDSHSPKTENTYCIAVEQLYNENVEKGNNVKFIDTFTLTKDMYEAAWKGDGKNSDAYGNQVMDKKTDKNGNLVVDATHSNKLGGMIEAALVADAIQNMALPISKTVKAPAGAQASTTDGRTGFTVDANGVFAAYDIYADPIVHATYWEGVGQEMFAAIAAKAEELNPGGGEDEPGQKTITFTVPAGVTIEVKVDGAVTALTGGKLTVADTAVVTFTLTVADDYELGTVIGASKSGETYTVNAAAVTITATKKTGADDKATEADIADLQAAIAAAKAKLTGVETSADGKDVATDKQWAKAEDIKALNDAIKAAEGVAGKADVTKTEVANAKKTVNDAANAFKTAPGTKEDKSDDSGNDDDNQGGGTTGMKPTGTHGSGGTTTNNTTNDDGSKTETVTDKAGNVTETTTKEDGTVEVVETKADGTVTDTVTKPDGTKTEKVTEPDGDVTVTATDADGEVVAKVEIPAEIPELDYTFEDVPEGHWAESAINAMAAMNVVKGVSGEAHVFDMTSDITRGAMAQILFNLSQGTEGKEYTFADAVEGAWYNDAVAWASDAGVVTGYADNTFGANDSITREQLAVMLYRYADLLGLDLTAEAKLDSFVDGESVSDWAANAVSWAVSKGLIQGKGANNLDPSASASRAETAVVLERFLGLVK